MSNFPQKDQLGREWKVSGELGEEGGEDLEVTSLYESADGGGGNAHQRFHGGAVSLRALQ